MKYCPSCEKGTIMAGKRNLLRGKYNPTKTKRKYPNLQWATFLSGKRYKICATCVKQGIYLHKEKPAATVKRATHKKSKYIHASKTKKVAHGSRGIKKVRPVQINKKAMVRSIGTHLEQFISREDRKNIKQTGRHE